MGHIAIIISVLIGFLIFGSILWRWINGNWTPILFGWLILLYGMYFAFFIGLHSSLVLPGVGSIALGAAAGASVGWATAALIGTIGVATGGAAIAIGALGMAAIGAVLGAVGAGSGGFAIKTSYYFLVTPWFWGPLILTGLALIIRGKSRKTKQPTLRVS